MNQDRFSRIRQGRLFLCRASAKKCRASAQNCRRRCTKLHRLPKITCTNPRVRLFLILATGLLTAFWGSAPVISRPFPHFSPPFSRVLASFRCRRLTGKCIRILNVLKSPVGFRFLMVKPRAMFSGRPFHLPRRAERARREEGQFLGKNFAQSKIRRIFAPEEKYTSDA